MSSSSLVPQPYEKTTSSAGISDRAEGESSTSSVGGANEASLDIPDDNYHTRPLPTRRHLRPIGWDFDVVLGADRRRWFEWHNGTYATSLDL